MNKVKAFIERGNDGSYGVYIDSEDRTLNYGIFGEGDSVDEAINDFKESYIGMKQIHEEEGRNFVEADFDIKYDVASFLNYYSGRLSLAGLGRITGINQRQLSHYVNGKYRPSKRTVQKINTSLHSFANDLQQVQLS